MTIMLPSRGRRAECRVHERLNCEFPGSCQPASGKASEEAKWWATLCDISLGGIRLLLHRRYERGTALAIELPGLDGQPPSTFFARVVHLCAQEDGLWSLGCQFVSPLSEEELERLVCLHLPEKRALSEVQLQVITARGTLIDCSVKQLKVPKSWPLRVGKTVTLRGADSSNSPWSLKVQVVHCGQEGKRWSLQCRLVNPPAADQVLRALSPAASGA